LLVPLSFAVIEQVPALTIVSEPVEELTVQTALVALAKTIEPVFAGVEVALT